MGGVYFKEIWFQGILGVLFFKGLFKGGVKEVCFQWRCLFKGVFFFFKRGATNTFHRIIENSPKHERGIFATFFQPSGILIITMFL